MASSFSDRSRAEAELAVLQAIPSPRSARKKRVSGDSRMIEILYQLFMGRSGAKLKSIDLSHVSAFRRKVYRELSRVPRGRVTTYGAIARKIDSRRFARAVGTAVASNPLSLVIPCHRVVPASLEVGNYGMPGRKPSEGSYIKRGILQREGVEFEGSKVSKESLWV